MGENGDAWLQCFDESSLDRLANSTPLDDNQAVTSKTCVLARHLHYVCLTVSGLPLAKLRRKLHFSVMEYAGHKHFEVLETVTEELIPSSLRQVPSYFLGLTFPAKDTEMS